MAATTEKTVHYALPMLGVGTGVTGSATHTDSADTTIYLPETTSRAFKSVIAEIQVRTNEATAASPSGVGARFSCDAGTTWTATTKTMTYTNSGEDFAFVFLVDVTAEFTARFSGASDTCRWGFYVNNSSNLWVSASCVLHITYEYDHTAHSTQLNSVLIPFESTTTATTTSLVEIGTNQMPNLSTFCPEASKTFRQVALVLDADYVTAGTTDSPLALAFDGEGETGFGTYEASLRSDGPVRVVWIRNDLSTSGTHALKWRHTAGGAFQRANGYFIVNYEYDTASTTSMLRSLQLPIGDDNNNTSPLSTDIMAEEIDFWVPESNPTLVQSGVQVYVNPTNAAATNFNLSFGSQSYRAYSIGSTNSVDRVTVTQRIDSGGVQGAGMTLAHGRSTLRLRSYSATASRHSCWGGIAFLNYTCDKPSAGVQVASRTLWQLGDAGLDGGTAADQNTTITPTALSIIEAAYWLSSVGTLHISTNAQGAYLGVTLAVERQSGEGIQAGWRRVGSGIGIAVNERCTVIDPLEHTRYWKKYPSDPRADRLDIETSRPWRYNTSQPVIGQFVNLVTLHNMTFTKSGTVSGYADADGAGLTVDWFWDNPENEWEKIAESTTTTGGAFSLTWYDDTVNLFASLREDATHVGRSEQGTS